MATEELQFTAAWARCKEHKNLLEFGETKCLKCKIQERNLSIKPPFRIYAIRSNASYGIKSGEVYTVLMVIKQGLGEHNSNLKGYLLRAETPNKDTLVEHVFEEDDFIPVEFLAEDKTDKWDHSIKEIIYTYGGNEMNPDMWEGM